MPWHVCSSPKSINYSIIILYKRTPGVTQEEHKFSNVEFLVILELL